MSSEAVSRIRFGPFEADLRAGELRKHGVRLRLSGQPLEILALLLAQPGEVVTREELRRKLWPENTFGDFDHGLNAAVNKLREALGDSAEAPRYVETLPRRGYRFIARVESPAAEPASLPPEAAPSPAPPPVSTGSAPEPPRPARGYRGPLVISGAVAAAGLVLLMIVAPSRREPSADDAARSIRSLAVLPFENLSGDADQEYFADGMTDEVISRLSGVGALRVISRTSVMPYRKARAPLPEIARKLGVEGIVEGAVQRSGDRVRITARLLHAPTDRSLWAETYERELPDVLRLQSEIASAIAQEVRVRVTPAERTRLDWARLVDPDAYQHHLRGRYFQGHWNSDRAAEEYRRSIAADPKYALAWAGLAEAELYRHPPREAMPRAEKAARRAVEIAPNLGETHAVLGLVQTFWNWDWAGAEASFRRAVALDPGSAAIRHRFSHLLAATGRLEEGIAQSRQALALDPLSPDVNHYLGRLYYFDHDLDRAVAQLRTALELDPRNIWAHLFLGLTYELQGKDDGAALHRVRAALLGGASPEIIAKWQEEYERLGYAALRLKILDFEAAQTRLPLTSSSLALGYARLGETEKAIEWLEKAFASHTRDLIYLKVEPSYDPVRDDPRFQALLGRLRLPDQAPSTP
jgi:TolB-like protein/DNA-binding winged helix-turn-helix (wHTH) protein/Tfp pilus assembly protein PilF